MLVPFTISPLIFHILLSIHLLPLVFGCVAFVHVSKQHQDKFDPQALCCVFLGYSSTQKGYKCYYPSTRKMIISKDVTFVENQAFFCPSASSHQGESLGGDQVLPILESIFQPSPSPTQSDGTSDSLPTATDSFLPTCSSLIHLDLGSTPTEVTSQEIPPSILDFPARFKGSPYVYKRRNQPSQCAQQEPTSSPQSGMKFS